jgi:hypothetical protein
MIIEIVEKNSFGRELLYPVSPCAHTLAKMVGQKTLLVPQLKLAADMGHTIRIRYASDETVATVRKVIPGVVVMTPTDNALHEQLETGAAP